MNVFTFYPLLALLKSYKSDSDRAVFPLIVLIPYARGYTKCYDLKSPYDVPSNSPSCPGNKHRTQLH